MVSPGTIEILRSTLLHIVWLELQIHMRSGSEAVNLGCAEIPKFAIEKRTCS